MNQEDNKLIELCGVIRNVSEDSMNWVSEHVEIDKQKMTIDHLKRFRRYANRYEAAVSKRPAIAIFGQSQVGKSYLVSNLAKTPEAYSLEVEVPGQNKRVDFIEAMNPPGGGKEATGLVSRFTIADSHKLGEQPYLLKLFSQSDIVKIIVNGYWSDITHYQYEVNPEDVRRILDTNRSKISTKETSGFSEDDVYDLQEYLEHNFKSHFLYKDLTALNFWDEIAAIIPYLDATLRWEIFELLWGKQDFFTEFFKQISIGLKQINFVSEARCGLEAVSPNTETILDVQRLREMYNASENPPVDLYRNGAKIGTLARSVISAITAEAVLPIPEETANHPQRGFLKYADILDFPGARSRNKIPELTFNENEPDKKLEVFLRGKVAFLFDRYNYNNEISTLLFCMDNGQPEVQDVPRLLYEWVSNTHGNSPEKREERERTLANLVPQNEIEKLIPLLVVQTKFNIDVEGNPATDKIGDPDSHNWKWNARLDANFHQFMSRPLSDKWPSQWSTSDGSFKNMFLLRDPKWSTAVYEGMDTDAKQEIKIRDEYIGKLQDMKTSFLNHPYAKKHFKNQEEAWNESTGIEKSGINYIVKYLTPTCNPIIKREQVKSRVQELKKEICDELSAFYQGGSLKEKLGKARINSAQVFMNLMKIQNSKNTFGNFIDKLVITDDLSNQIYFDVMMRKQIDLPQKDSNPDGPTIPTDLLEMLSDFIDISENESADNILRKLKDMFGIEEDNALQQVMEDSGIDIKALLENKNQKQRTQPANDRAFFFSGKLIGKWLERISKIKAPDVLEDLGLSKKIADLIVKELDKTKNRVDLKNRIADSVREHVNNFQITGNIDVVARISANVINRFVNTLGWAFVQDSERPKTKESDVAPIFTPGTVHSPEKKNLKLGVKFPGEQFFNDWATGIRKSFEANVYFEENVKDEEKAAANEKLGTLIQRVK